MSSVALRLASATALALGALAAAAPAHAGKDLEAIKSRGALVCGVNTGLAGFSAADSQGRWTGIDVDYCRALAAAILSDPNKVRFSPLTAQQRFTALQSGEIDVLSRNTTWTLTRDASLGMHFVGVTFYDGQGFMVPKSLNVKSAKQLKGATVCVQSGTTTELNLTDYSRANNLADQAGGVREAGSGNRRLLLRPLPGLHDRCLGAGLDPQQGSAEAGRPRDPSRADLQGTARPVGAARRRRVLRHRQVGVQCAARGEEYGITQANIDTMKKDSKNPSVMRLLGAGTEDTGKVLGLDKDWAYRAIKAVGNYGEIFERHVGEKTAIGLPRGSNNLWTQGGLMYAPPVR
jgi:general L-amino acid transport system substrate-binding protein